MVERPETLKRQNSSVPSINMAERKATEGSNRRRAKKYTRLMAAKKSSWLNKPIRKSGS